MSMLLLERLCTFTWSINWDLFMKTDIQKIIMDDVLGLTYPGNLPDYTINKAVRGMFLIISIDCIILTYHNL